MSQFITLSMMTICGGIAIEVAELFYDFRGRMREILQ